MDREDGGNPDQVAAVFGLSLVSDGVKSDGDTEFLV